MGERLVYAMAILLSHIASIGQRRKQQFIAEHSVLQSETPAGQQHLEQQLRGRILRMVSAAVAEVELPRGRVRAKITGMRPIVNVDLLFAVRKQSASQLWLQVTGIASAAPLTTKDILVALDLPSAPLYQEIAAALRARTLFLRKTELRQLFHFVESLQAAATSGEKLPAATVVQVYQLLEHLQLPHTAEFAKLLLPLFQFPITEIAHWLRRYQLVFLQRLGKWQQTAEKMGKGKPETAMSATTLAATVLPEATGQEQQNAHLLPLSTVIEAVEEKETVRSEKLWSELKAFVEAEICYNLFAWARGFPLQWTGMLSVGEVVFPIRLTFEGERQQGRSEFPLSFSVESHTMTLGQVWVEGTVVGRKISLAFWMETPEAQEYLHGRVGRLQQRLYQVGFQQVVLRVGLLQEQPQRRGYQQLNIVL